MRLTVMAFALLGISSVAGCNPYSKTTVVEVRDPTLVRYTSAGVVIPVSNSRDAVIADHDIIYRGDRFAELVVTAHQTPGGSLVTSWRSDPAIWAGERRIGIDNSGIIAVPDEIELTGGSQNELTVFICGRFDDFGSHSGTARAHVGTSVTLGVPCELTHDVAISATTPLSNVRSVRVVGQDEKPL